MDQLKNSKNKHFNSMCLILWIFCQKRNLEIIKHIKVLYLNFDLMKIWALIFDSNFDLVQNQTQIFYLTFDLINQRTQIYFFNLWFGFKSHLWTGLPRLDPRVPISWPSENLMQKRNCNFRLPTIFLISVFWIRILPRDIKSETWGLET
jgi:hypothetical protein